MAAINIPVTNLGYRKALLLEHSLFFPDGGYPPTIGVASDQIDGLAIRQLARVTAFRTFCS